MGFLTDFHQIRGLAMKTIAYQSRQYVANICSCMTVILCLSFVAGMQLLVDRIIPKDLFKPEIIRPKVVDFQSVLVPEIEKSKLERFLLSVNGNERLRQVMGFKNRDGTGDGLLSYMRQYPHNDEYLPYFQYENSSKAINTELFAELDGNRQGKIKTVAAYIVDEWKHGNISYTVEFDNRTATSLCKGTSDFQCVYDMPTAMINMFNSILLEKMLGHEIRAKSGQMPYERPGFDFKISSLLGYFFFPLVLISLLPVMMYQITSERILKIREMMKLVGMRMRNYVLVMYAFQYGIYLVNIFLFVLFGLIFNFDVVWKTNAVLQIIVYIGWGLELTSFSWLLASLVPNVLAGVIISYCVVLFSPSTANTILSLIGSRNTGFQYGWINLIFPFSISSYISEVTEQCTFRCPGFTSIWDNPILLSSWVSMYVTGVVFLLLSLYIDEVNFFQPWGVPKHPCFCFMECFRCLRRRNHRRYAQLVEDELEDDDVKVMREKIISGEYTKDNSGILVDGLGKKYRRFEAVKGIHFRVKKGEIFGLLGANGAGKTSTSNMLSGVIAPTKGDAFINGYSVRNDLHKVRMSISMVPQFDVHWPSLTCIEHLLVFARLKGVSFSKEKAHVRSLLKRVGLWEQFNQKKGKKEKIYKRKSKALSGGMRRRLSLAMALVGDPQVILLDEFTSGVDRYSSRFLMDLVKEVSKDRTIVLTTHSLEEAEALCDSICVMSKGKIKCIGSTNHLKEKFGSGYYITVTHHEDDLNKVTSYLQSLFNNELVMSSQFTRQTTFSVNRELVDMGKLFQTMEAEKDQHGIIEWSITDSSLDDVFIQILNQDEVNEKKNS